jgi:endonuclease/exonuclease/phosphatase family metal-dependent hydrolase
MSRKSLSGPLRLTSWNLLNGRSLVDGSATRETLEKGVSRFLEEFTPDILAIQEVDDLQPRSDGIHQSKVIADLLGTEYWHYQPTLFGTPGGEWSTTQQEESPTYGIALISRREVKTFHIKELGTAPFGAPLAIPTQKGIGIRYVPDEPRVVVAAELMDGTIIASTHLSFVPGFNVKQLRTAERWLRELSEQSGGNVILMGDFNLPWGLATKVTSLQSLTKAKSYPSWSPKVQFDYILASSEVEGREITHGQALISDHRPISAVVG